MDVVDALADERAFTEDILIKVGNGSRIGVYPRLAAEKSRISGAVGPGQAHRDARLKNAVTAGHQRSVAISTPRVESRAIQRLRHRADELTRGVTRQLGIGVERDNVLHSRQQRRVADDQRERVAGTAQERIEVREFSSLTLKSHPDPFLRIPASRAMEQKERTVAVAVTGQGCFQRVIRGATDRIAVLCG